MMIAKKIAIYTQIRACCVRSAHKRKFPFIEIAETEPNNNITRVNKIGSLCFY